MPHAFIHPMVRQKAALLALVLPACGRTEAPRAPAPLLRETTAEVGLEASPAPWPPGRYRIPEITAAGLALIDFDGDGRLDIYQVSHPPPDRPDAPAPNRLFRQLDDGSFAEVRGAAGLADPGYGNGAAVGDADGDGDDEIYVSNLGADSLYRNEGDGTFADVTAASGIREDGWSTSAAFLDYDRDGDLDLYVCHYLIDDPARICRPSTTEDRDYCGPSRYQSSPDTLFRNEGDGTFTDMSRAAGITHPRAGLGVACADFTGDGWVDIYVANDKQPNQLHVNRQDGSFIDEALERGVAVNGSGDAEASMGVAAGDINADGRLDIFLTHLVDETATLYLSAGDGTYDDRSASSAIGGPTLRFTGWGCGFVDLDHDGDLDLALVNGRIARGPNPARELGPFWGDYAETNQLFLQEGTGRFVDATPRGGAFASRPAVTRALAFGDLDGDGDVDLVTSDVSNRLRVFRNEAPPPGCHWLRIRARTRGRDALGALIAVTAGGKRQVRPLISAYSFASASEPVAHFGLGEATHVERIEVLWPDGSSERFRTESVDRLVTLVQGEGKRASR